MLGNLTILIAAYVVMRAMEALAAVVPPGVLQRILHALVALAAVALLFLAPIVAIDTVSSSMEISRKQQELQNLWR